MQISYEYEGFPEFLRSEGACKRAVELGRIGAETPIVVYEENGDRTRIPAREHPVLRSLLGLDLPEAETPREAAALPEILPEAPALTEAEGTAPFRQDLPVPAHSPPARRPRAEVLPPAEPRIAAAPPPDNGWYWMTLALRRYGEFEGRSRRKEYWMFALLTALATLLAIILGQSTLGNLLLIVIVLGGAIPGLAVAVRRLHDLGLSGWMVLINLLPYAGSLIFLILMMIEGKPGPNSYGPNPKESAGASVFE